MAYQQLYVSYDATNVEPPHIPRSGNDELAAVRRDELDQELAALNTRVNNDFLTINYLKDRQERLFILDEATDGITRTTNTVTYDGRSYVETTYEVTVSEWANADWVLMKVAFDREWEHHNDVGVRKHMSNTFAITFQSDTAVDNGEWKLVLEASLPRIFS